MTARSEQPEGATDPSHPDPGGSDRNQVVRQLLTALSNVALLTALLVYFGWVRSEVQARLLGIDESILGMSTRDYLLRSVRPVLVLVIAVALSTLLWIVSDRWLTTRRSRHGADDPTFRRTIRYLPLLAICLPTLTLLAGFVWRATAYIIFPFACAGCLLLLLYAFYLRQSLPGALALPPGRESLLRASIAVIVGVALFTAASHYATVEGTRLASGFQRQLPSLPGVSVYTTQQMHIRAPGVKELRTPGHGERFRYTGLRLLERTDSRYFLVSDGWTPEHGVVVVLPDSSHMRVEFVRR